MRRQRKLAFAVALIAFGCSTLAAQAGGGAKLPPADAPWDPRSSSSSTQPRRSRRRRSAPRQFWAQLKRAAVRWRDPRAAHRAGFDTHLARRAPARVGYLHAEHQRFSHDGRYLDPRRPESLIYANMPGRKLVLVGVMFSMPRGMRGRTPGGPMMRWHWHSVCARGDRRGLAPRADGSCPPGSVRRAGSEMMHVWFTRDLRSGFAIHAPEPELCSAGLLSTAACYQLLCDLP